jgi:hypothetical protein
MMIKIHQSHLGLKGFVTEGEADSVHHELEAEQVLQKVSIKNASDNCLMTNK